ncbi:MAG TPA: hypothetical protein PKD18_08845 [Saprospiraceae bacterium]|nr:hypothetical protein [Saprospiraceae bacterium]
MKKIFLLVLCGFVLIQTAVFGQNVGINNDNPETALDVRGQIRTRPEFVIVNSEYLFINSDSGLVVLIDDDPAISENFFLNLQSKPVGTFIACENRTTNDAIIVGIITLKPGKICYLMQGEFTWQLIGPLEESTFWSINGNAFTDPGFNFIGTVDNNDLIFRRNFVKSGLIGTSNTTFGYNSLQSSSGGFNTAFGANAFQLGTTGSENVALGANTLFNAQQATKTTAIGVNSMYWMNDGSITGNTAVGFDAMRFKLGNSANNTGFDNVAFGRFAMGNLTQGIYNTAIGTNSMASNEIGHANVALGYNTLSSNVSGSNNVALGNQAGSAETTSNKLYIENTGANKDNALIYGDFLADSLMLNGKVIIKNSLNIKGTSTFTGIQLGYDDPTKQVDAGKIQYGGFGGDTHILNIVGGGTNPAGNDRKIKIWSEGGTDLRGSLNLQNELKLNGNSGTAGQVLTSQGAGNPTWTNPSSSNSIRFLVSYNSNTNNGLSDILTTIYNQSPTNISVVGNDVIVNQSGLYRLTVVNNAGATFSSTPAVVYTDLILYINNGSAFYNIPLLYRNAFDKNPYAVHVPSGSPPNYVDAYTLNTNHTIDVFLEAGSDITVSAFTSFGMGGSGGTIMYRYFTGTLSGYLISE